MAKKLNITKEDFVNKLNELYGNKYELVGEYIDHLTQVDIICHGQNFLGEEHGVFKARPIDIMKKVLGCPKCGGTKKSNTEEWIKKASYVHNGFFVYDEKTIYTGSNNKITVKCPYHGYIEVKANNHLNGANCFQCSKEGRIHNITRLPQINNSTTKLTSDGFFKRLNEIHGDKYDISKTVFKNVKTQVTLICHKKDEFGNEHGEFQISPLKLFLGRGCRKCANNFPRTSEMFIKESKEIHGENAFDYSEVNYKGNHVKIWLTCKKCGYRFAVEPGNHITFMQGCPMCATSKLERMVKKMLDDNDIKNIPQYKEGLKGLKADFYLPDYKIAIECHGLQHFEPVKFTTSISDEESKENFKKQVERDDKKYHLLSEQGVKLLYYTNCNVTDYRYPLIKDLDSLLKEITSTDRKSEKLSQMNKLWRKL